MNERFAKNDQYRKKNNFDLQQQLHVACENGDAEKVRALLRLRFNDVNYSMGVKEIADPNDFFVQWVTSTEKAIHKDDLNWKLPDPFKVIKFTSALYVAAENGHSEVVKILLEEAKADVEESGKDGNMPLFIAANNNHADVVEVLLKHVKPTAITQENSHGASPLTIASKLGHKKIVEMFLAQDVVVNKPIGRAFTTPLHEACKNGQSEIVKLLLAQKANIHALDAQGNSALHYACLSGNIECVNLLLQNGINVNAQNENGLTPLHDAAFVNHSAIVKLLLTHQAEIDTQDKQGATALLLAIQNDSTNIAKMLIAAGADVDLMSYSNVTTSIDGQLTDVATYLTPLMYAAIKKNKEIVELLIEKKPIFYSNQKFTLYTSDEIASLLNSYAPKNAVKIKNGNYPTAETIKSNPTIEKLLNAIKNERQSRSINLLEKVKITTLGPTQLLCNAVTCGKLDVAEFLLKQGTNPNVLALVSMSSPNENDADLSGDISPLHIAANNNDLKMAQLLLKYKADPNIVTSLYPPPGDKTPLHIACCCGNIEMASLLLANGANVNLIDKEAHTALHYACVKKNYKLVELLLSQGAKVNFINNKGLTSLHIAALMNDVNLVRLLLEHGAKINLQSLDGKTALCFAALEGHEEIVNLLIEKGANIELGAFGKDDQNTLGWKAESAYYYSPLFLAAYQDHANVVDLLLQNHAKVNTENLHSPLYMAVQNQKVAIVSKLIAGGAKVNANVWNSYPIFAAVRSGNTQILALLIAAGADVNVVENGHTTPLQLAIELGHVDMVRQLLVLATNADVHVKTWYWGRTAIQWAMLEKNVEILSLLQQKIANSNDEQDLIAKQKIQNVFTEQNGKKRLLSFLNDDRQIQKDTDITIENRPTKFTRTG